MRLYLSSYRFGCGCKELLSLMRGGNKAIIIGNALDHISMDMRLAYIDNVYNPINEFLSIGINSEYLDLRDYFENNTALTKKIKEFDLVWILGGNVFLLRRAMKQSGFDKIICDLLVNDQIVYGGFSAATVVAGRTLSCIDLIDNPNQIAEGYHSEIIWDGLGLIDFSIVPHCQSLHPETEAAEKAAALLKEKGFPFKKLKDGQVFLVDGETSKTLT